MESDGAGVVSGSLVDWRSDGSPRAREISLALGGGLVVDQAAVATLPHGLLVEAVTFSISNPGAGTAGSTVADLELWDGAAWVSLFAGDTGRRPTIPFGEEEPTSAIPDTRVLPPGARIRARIAGLPTGGAAPNGCELLVQGEIP
jgi:hypothetical protein